MSLSALLTSAVYITRLRVVNEHTVSQIVFPVASVLLAFINLTRP